MFSPCNEAQRLTCSFSLPLSENPYALDYVLPDYNEIKQGYTQAPSSSSVSISNNVDTSKKSTKQQQQVKRIRGFGDLD